MEYELFEMGDELYEIFERTQENIDNINNMFTAVQREDNKEALKLIREYLVIVDTQVTLLLAAVDAAIHLPNIMKEFHSACKAFDAEGKFKLNKGGKK